MFNFNKLAFFRATPEAQNPRDVEVLQIGAVTRANHKVLQMLNGEQRAVLRLDGILKRKGSIAIYRASGQSSSDLEKFDHDWIRCRQMRVVGGKGEKGGRGHLAVVLNDKLLVGAVARARVNLEAGVNVDVANRIEVVVAVRGQVVCNQEMFRIEARELGKDL